MEESSTQRMYDQKTLTASPRSQQPCHLPSHLRSCLVCSSIVSPCPICRSSYLSFAPSSSLSAFAAPLLNCSGCGLSLLCQRCCSTSDVTSVLGDALERHTGRMCSQSPSFIVEHTQSSLSAQHGLMQQLRLVCAGCGLNETVQV